MASYDVPNDAKKGVEQAEGLATNSNEGGGSYLYHDALATALV